MTKILVPQANMKSLTLTYGQGRGIPDSANEKTSKSL